jgi:disulfide bond formation protein DsbB
MAFLIIGLVTLLTILGALYFEYVLNLKPCKLCLQQRWTYYLTLMISPFLFVFAHRQSQSKAVLFGLIALIALWIISALLGTYHAGVEWRWWAGPSDCGATGGASAQGVQGVNDFLTQLQSVRVVSCEDAAWRFIGLSLAGWNAVISLIIACYLTGVSYVQISCSSRLSINGSSPK